MATGRSAPSFSMTTFEKCTAQSIGSGLYTNGFAKPLLFNGCVFLDNYSPNEGAGIYLDDRADAKLWDILFIANRAYSSGAALTANIDSTAEIRRCTFKENWSGSKGGALAGFNHARVTMMNSTLFSNWANTGGAVYATDSAQFDLTDCLVNNNTAFSRAGGFYLSSQGVISLRTSTLSNNSALDGPGGGVALSDSSFLNMTFASFVVSASYSIISDLACRKEQ